MSLWNSFKRKIEETTSGLDFWDKDENKRQRDFYAGITPSNTGGIRVAAPQAQPEIRVQAPVGQPQLEVAAPTFANTAKPLQVAGTKDYSQVDAGLDAGKSWEDISRETGVNLDEVRGYSQRTRPDYGMKTENYRAMEIGPEKNKTIGGWNAAALLPASLEKTRSVGAGGDINTSEQGFIQRFDQTNDEYRKFYLDSLNQQAQKGDETAKRTIDALRRNGRLKGDAMDFIEGSNDKLIGGLSRGVSRTVGFVASNPLNNNPVTRAIPGVNKVVAAQEKFRRGAEGFADWSDASSPDEVTDLGNKGEQFGTAQKAAVDLVSLIVPASKVDKIASASKYANTGSKIINYGTRIIPGSLTGTGVDMLQEKGRGNDPNAGRSLAIGTAADLAMPVVLKPLAKVGSKVLDPLLSGGKNQISRLLNRGAEEGLEEAPSVMVKFSDDLRSVPGISSELKKVSSKNINLGSDTLGSDLDPAQVARYIDDIKAGRPIDPLVVTEEGGGIFLQDGKHRMAALNQLGIDELPVVTRNMDRAAQATPAGILPTPAGAKPNSTQSIADLLPDLKARQAQNLNIDQELAQKYGVAEQTVKRLRNGYGDEQARNILARSSDATNIRNMDAFVVSEARKAYGSPNVNIQRGVPKVVETADEAIPVPSATKVTPETAVEGPPSKLGQMVDEFYQSKQGNERIKYRDLEDLGKRVSKQVDADFKAIGTDFPTVARKVQEGARNGAKTLDEAGLTNAEADILRKAQSEMNYVRRRASIGRKEVGGGDFGEMYLPQQKEGQYGGERLFEGFRETKPGSEFARKNAIELEDLDYSPEVIGEYVTRYGDTKLYQQERLARALAKNNEGLPQEQIDDAAAKLIALQDDVNKVQTKIGAFGFGTRKQLADGKYIDTAKRMTEIGEGLDHKITIVADEGKGLTNGDRINSVSIDGQKLADRLGLNQYRDAQSYAAKQFTDASGDREALASMVAERLQRDFNLKPDDIEYAVGGISRIAPNVPDEVVLAKVTSTYKQAAKQQLLEELQHVDITNNKLRKDVSNLANQILREGSIESQLSQKVTSKVLQTQNAIFRKFNIGSALNELSDLNSFISVYGKNTKLIPDFKAVEEFGLGEIDAAIAPYVRQLESGAKMSEVLRSINDKTNLYKFVEHYKAAVVANTARDFYMKQGLRGDALTAKVLDDYRTLALPVDAFTKTILDNAPLYTQYMTWGLRNLQKEGRLATGKIGAGILEDKSTMERIARNAYANLPAKTVFWLSSNALKGTAFLTAFGLTDFTGMTNQDYSGIAEEDKSWFDKTTQYTNTSTTLSMLNSVIQSFEKEQLRQKYKDADYNPYENARLDQDILAKYTPSFIKNVTGTNDMLEKGYSENKSGRVQYEAPTDFWNIAKSYMFGKSQTDNAREYSGATSVLQGNNPISMFKEQLGLEDRDYTRPLTDDYSKAYKEAETGARTALLEGGRQYNKYLDDLKKNNKPAYDSYISAMDGNHVDPEYWKAISGGDPGKIDLNTFNMMRNRKKQAAKDLGKAYDPLYDLTDEQARSVLQQKSTATGDDLALRNALYKEQWYKDYMAKVKDYYDSKESTDSDFEQTQRVRDWYSLNDQYNALRDPTNADMAKNFPLVAQQKAITAKYGFGSEEGKAWFKANADAYEAEKAAFDKANLDLINKMRAIEGYPPMSEDQYAQVTKIADTDGKDKKGGYGSGNSSFYGKEGDYGRTRGLDLPSVKIKVNKVKIEPRNKPKTVKIVRKKLKG